MKEIKNKKEKRQLINQISEEILKVADLKNDVTRSDLQGVSEATAINIIKIVGGVN